MNLLFKDFFRRGAVFACLFLLGLAAMSVTASLFDEETQIELLGNGHGDQQVGSLLQRLMLLVMVFAIAGTTLLVEVGYVTSFMFCIMAMGDISKKWPRVALTLPVSRRTIELTLWIECVIVPSVFTLLAAIMVLLLGGLNASFLAESFDGVSSMSFAELSLVAMPRVFIGSLCFCGSLLLFMQTSRMLVNNMMERKFRPLVIGAIFLSAMICFIAFLAAFGLALVRFPTVNATGVLLFVVALGMTALSFRNRQSLLFIFEPFRGNDRDEVPRPSESTPREKRRLLTGFSKGYAWMSFWVVAITSSIFVLGLGFIYVIMYFENGSQEEKLAMHQHADGVYALFVLALVPLAVSFMSTPPLCVCRILPLRAFRLFIRMVACPTVLFLAFAMNILILVGVFTDWDIVHAISIPYFVFGIGVLIQGYAVALRQETFGLTVSIVIAIVFGGFLYYGSAMLDFIFDLVRVPAILMAVGTIGLALGSLFWYAGIAYSSASYKYPFTRELGKRVL